MEDVVKYTVRALGCSYVVNKQLHIRPRLNQVSQHDLIHIYEDKLFRQQGIGQRLVRAPVSEADLDAQIAGDSPLSPRLTWTSRSQVALVAQPPSWESY